MRNLAPAFLSRLRSETTTLAFCWRLSLRDGTVLGFTSHDQRITIEGVVYQPQNAIVPSAFQQDLSLGADDVQLSVMFSSEQVSEQDLVTGRLDAAQYLYFLIDWQFPPTSLATVPATYLELSAGRLGEWSANTQSFKAEGLGLLEQMAEAQPLETSPVCRATLGDNKCKVVLTSFTHDLTVVEVNGRAIITNAFDRPDGYFDNGNLTFLTGSNAPDTYKIERWANTANQITLLLPPNRPVSVGDSIRCVAGCGKLLSVCRDKFSNVLNFQGEPSIPGQDVWVSGQPVDGPENED